MLFVIVATFLISLIALAGSLILFLNERILNKTLLILISFAAGSLMGSAFFHLLPEAVEGAGQRAVLWVFLYAVLGFCLFFILENIIKWHHHHTALGHPEIKSFSYLILFSDGFHNFIDGLIVAAAFASNPFLGVTTTLAVAFHEIPQEIGDFGVLIYGGIKKTKALFLNFLSALTVVLGGIAGWIFLEKIESYTAFFLAFAGGSFIYIAASDLLPEVKKAIETKKSLLYFLIFLLGLGLMLAVKLLSFEIQLNFLG